MFRVGFFLLFCSIFPCLFLVFVCLLLVCLLCLCFLLFRFTLFWFAFWLSRMVFLKLITINCYRRPCETRAKAERELWLPLNPTYNNRFRNKTIRQFPSPVTHRTIQSISFNLKSETTLSNILQRKLEKDVHLVLLMIM